MSSREIDAKLKDIRGARRDLESKYHQDKFELCQQQYDILRPIEEDLENKLKRLTGSGFSLTLPEANLLSCEAVSQAARIKLQAAGIEFKKDSDGWIAIDPSQEGFVLNLETAVSGSPQNLHNIAR
jgi:hypothetical protein